MNEKITLMVLRGVADDSDAGIGDSTYDHAKGAVPFRLRQNTISHKASMGRKKMLKIVMIGDGSVGKTSIRNRVTLPSSH